MVVGNEQNRLDDDGPPADGHIQIELSHPRRDFVYGPRDEDVGIAQPLPVHFREIERGEDVETYMLELLPDPGGILLYRM